MTDLRTNGSKFSIIGTDPCFTMTVENEAPGKEALVIFKELRSARARRVWGVVVGFTGELHRFSSVGVFFRWHAVSFEANIYAVNVHGSAH